MLTGIAFVAAVALPLEWAFRARDQRWRRPGLATDVAFLLFQYLVMAAVLATLHDLLRTTLLMPEPPLPLPARVVLGVVLGDLGLYWGHRLSHRWSWLWRFHRVHHTSTHLDWVAAHREHPIDGLWSQLTFQAPMLLLGVDLEIAMPLLVFRGAWAVVLHSNSTLPLGPLGLLLGDPVLHRAHHARDRPAANFGNLAPYLDLLFGTHHRPADETYALGVPDDRGQGFLGLLLRPATR